MCTFQAHCSFKKLWKIFVVLPHGNPALWPRPHKKTLCYGPQRIKKSCIVAVYKQIPHYGLLRITKSCLMAHSMEIITDSCCTAYSTQWPIVHNQICYSSPQRITKFTTVAQSVSPNLLQCSIAHCQILHSGPHTWPNLLQRPIAGRDVKSQISSKF